MTTAMGVSANLQGMPSASPNIAGPFKLESWQISSLWPQSRLRPAAFPA